MTGKLRSNIRPGALVDIVLKRDQPTGKLTRGHVKRGTRLDGYRRFWRRERALPFERKREGICGKQHC